MLTLYTLRLPLRLPSFGRAAALSLDHNPESEVEAIRVHNAGGIVTKEGRINGNLAVSRTLGKEPYVHLQYMIQTKVFDAAGRVL